MYYYINTSDKQKLYSDLSSKQNVLYKGLYIIFVHKGAGDFFGQREA